MGIIVCPTYNKHFDPCIDLKYTRRCKFVVNNSPLGKLSDLMSIISANVPLWVLYNMSQRTYYFQSLMTLGPNPSRNSSTSSIAQNHDNVNVYHFSPPFKNKIFDISGDLLETIYTLPDAFLTERSTQQRREQLPHNSSLPFPSTIDTLPYTFLIKRRTQHLREHHPSNNSLPHHNLESQHQMFDTIYETTTSYSVVIIIILLFTFIFSLIKKYKILSCNIIKKRNSSNHMDVFHVESAREVTYTPYKSFPLRSFSLAEHDIESNNIVSDIRQEFEAQTIVLKFTKVQESYVNVILDVLNFYRRVTASDNLSVWAMEIFDVLRHYYSLNEMLHVLSVVLNTATARNIEPQSFASLDQARSFVENWDALSESELLTQLNRILCGLISTGLLARTNLNFSEEGYKELFGQSLPKFKHVSLHMLLKDCVKFCVSFAETGYECFVDKSLRPILVKNRKTRTWLTKFRLLVEEIDNIPINIDAQPGELMEKSRVLLYEATVLMMEDKFITPFYKIMMAKMEHLTRSHGIATFRKPPFSLLIHGTPGIGKSSLVQIFTTHYHRIVTQNGFHDIEYDPTSSVYTYNSKDQFWSGFRGASHWAIIMDDLASEHVKHVQNGSVQSLNDVITLINSVGVASVQAAIEDKGKIPIIPKLVIATTNVKHLNASYGVAVPAAVLRRFPYVINPVLKKEFLGTNGAMAYSENMELNAWNFKLEFVRQVHVKNSTVVVYDVYSRSAKGPIDPELVTDQDDVLLSMSEIMIVLTSLIKKHEINSNKMSKRIFSPDESICKHGVLESYECPKCDDEVIEFEAIAQSNDTLSAFFQPVEISFHWIYKVLFYFLVCTITLLPTGAAHWVIAKITKRSHETAIHILEDMFNMPIPIGILALREIVIGATQGVLAYYITLGLASFIFPNKKEKKKAKSVDEEDDLEYERRERARARSDYKKQYHVPHLDNPYQEELTDINDEFHRKMNKQEFVSNSKNIWYSDDKDTGFSVPATSKSGNYDELVNSITKSMFRLNVRTATTTQDVIAFHVADGWFCTVNHAFDGSDTYQCVAFYGTKIGNVSPTQAFTLRESQLKRLKRDTVLFQFGGICSRKHLFKFLPKAIDPRGRDGFIISFNMDGTTEIGKVETIGLSEVEYRQDNGDITRGEFIKGRRIDRNPRRGDCGSLIILSTIKGYYLSAMHCAGSPESKGNYIICVPLSQSFLQLETPELVTPDCGDLSLVDRGSKKSGVLCKPYHKGLHHWVPQANAIMLGSYKGRSTQRSFTKRSLLCKDIERVFKFKNNLVAPLMGCEHTDSGDWLNPYTLAVQEQGLCSPHFDQPTVMLAANAYVKDLTDDIEWLSDTGSVDNFTAINGIDGDSYVNLLPMSTSGGFLFPGAKKQYFNQIDDKYYAKDEVNDLVQHIETCFKMGERANVIFQGALKDEPIKLKKRLIGKTRVFTACDVAFSIVVRKQFIKLTRAIMTNNVLTECAVGINCYSEKWGELYSHLTAFGQDKIIAGDYKSYDKQMPGILIRSAFHVLMQLRQQYGMSCTDILICQGIAAEISFPIINMNGDVFQFFGGNPSGQPLTVIINSIVNSIYMRISYMDILKTPDLSSFKDNVHLLTLGDDNIMGSNLDDFNHSNISLALHNRGVTYTMADKDSVSVPFIHINDADFLKRKFIKFGDRIIAPLDLNSIFKSMTMIVQKDNISEEETLAQSYLSSRREWSLHGEKIFNEYTSNMEQILEKYPRIKDYFIPKHFYTYQKTYDWVCDREENNQNLMNVKRESCQEEDGALQFEPQSLKTVHLTSHTSRHSWSSTIIEQTKYRNTIQIMMVYDLSYPLDTIAPCAFIRTMDLLNFKGCVLPQTKGCVLPQNLFSIEPQSSTNTTIHANKSMITAVSTDEGSVIKALDDGVSADADIQNFLSRKVQIFTNTWSHNTVFNHSFDPWDKFLNNPAVKNKLQNYYLTKGDLKLTFFVNGTPFHAGMLLASYSYLGISRFIYNATGDEHLKTLSQRPHLWLNASTNKGGCMCVPFFLPQNYLSLTSSIISASNIGKVYIHSAANLEQISGGTDKVTVTVFAELVNFKLTAPTMKAVALSGTSNINFSMFDIEPQSSNDEYSTEGVISGPASTVADIAGKLTSVPVIAPFAMATQIAAGGLADIARLFGYSRPVVLEDIKPMRNFPVSSLALTEGGDTSQKLTVTGKQEITIDPRTVGLPAEDSLSIKYLAGKESYLTQFVWGVADTVDTDIFACEVNPMAELRASVVGGYRNIPSSLSYVSRAFEAWSGSITYRFQVIASQYHRGRIAIVYDPTGPMTGDPFNTTFNTIIDLAEGRDFSVTFNWQQDMGYLHVNVVDGADFYSSTVTSTRVADRVCSNGIFYVRVVNELVVPDSVTDVKILMSIKAEDDFELMNPTSQGLNAFIYEPQALTNDMYHNLFKIEPQSSAVEVTPMEENAPEGEMNQLDVTTGILNSVDEKSSIFYGERIKSVRQLLKRYTYYRTFSHGRQTGAVFDTNPVRWKIYNKAMPAQPGFDPNGPDTTAALTSYTYVGPSYINYFKNAFAGWRGSIRYKYLPTNGTTTSSSIQRYSNPTYRQIASTLRVLSSVEYTPGTTTADVWAYNNTVSNHSSSGMAVTQNKSQDALEVEIPYVLPIRFSSTEGNYNTLASNTLANSYPGGDGYLATFDTSNGYLSVNTFVAAGEDFTLFGYLGAPVFYTYSTPVA